MKFEKSKSINIMIIKENVLLPMIDHIFMPKFSVASIGNVYFDETYIIERYPEADEKVTARDVKIALGGSASNVSTALSNLDMDAYLFSKLGNDSTASELLQILVEKRIIVKYISKVKGNSGRTIILLDNKKQSTKIGYSGVCSTLTDLQHLDALSEFSHVHLASVRAEMIDMVLKKKGNASISVDIGAKTLEGDLSALRFNIDKVDLLFMNRGAFKKIYNYQLTELHQLKLKPILFITAGEEGIYALDSGNVYREAAKEVIVVDTTGAGDAAAAAIIYGFLHGESVPVLLKRGVISATKKIQTYGASNGHITQEELEKQLQI